MSLPFVTRANQELSNVKMFVHSGASFHGHEFGGQGNAANSSRPSLMRSAFSTPTNRKSMIATESFPASIIHRTRRPVSEYIPQRDDSEKRVSVRFQEPEAGDVMREEDEISMGNGSGSEASTFGRMRRRRALRTCTTFHLAHPAPALTQIQKLLEIRPKLILQLQRLSAESRPTPVIDVLPSSTVVPRLVKRFPRVFRDKWELSYNDVMIVKSEDYNTTMEHMEEHGFDDDGIANRDLLAVICQLRKDHGGQQGMAEIVLHDGTVWVATPVPNGPFEFISRNQSGTLTTARWVKRINKSKVQELSEAGLATEALDEFKYTFSIINPNSRRHPILGTMTRNRLDIPDYYTSVSSSAGRFPPTSPIGAYPLETDNPLLDDEPPPERTTHEIDDSMKNLIQVTAIWVALRQGWSPYFRYNDLMASGMGLAHSQGSFRGRTRSASLTPSVSGPSPAPSVRDTESHHSFGGSIGSRIRRLSIRGSPEIPPTAQFENPIIPKRSTSHGSAFMERITARKAVNSPTTSQGNVDAENSKIVTGLPRTRASTFNVRRSITPSGPPPSFATARSQASTPGTPTRSLQKRPPSRPQSVYIPSPTYETGYFQNNYFDGKPQRQSMLIPDTHKVVDSGEKQKSGRWRTLSNIFRRTN